MTSADGVLIYQVAFCEFFLAVLTNCWFLSYNKMKGTSISGGADVKGFYLHMYSIALKTLSLLLLNILLKSIQRTDVSEQCLPKKGIVLVKFE